MREGQSTAFRAARQCIRRTVYFVWRRAGGQYIWPATTTATLTMFPSHRLCDSNACRVRESAWFSSLLQDLKISLPRHSCEFRTCQRLKQQDSSYLRTLSDSILSTPLSSKYSGLICFNLLP